MNTLKLDEQTVYFGNAENMSEIGDGVVDLVVTSPPYWNLKDYEHPDQIGQEDYASYLGRLDRVWQECYRVSTERGILAVNVNTRRHRKVFYPIAFDLAQSITGWVLIDIVIWYVPNALPQPHWYLDKVHDNKFEFVLVFAKDYSYDYTFNKVRVKQKYRDRDSRLEKYHAEGRGIGNVIRIPSYRPPTVRKLNYHLAAFPEELPYYLIHTYTNPGDLVLDPFVGSGTTLKVARNLGRRGMGYELNEDFRDVMAKRIGEDWEGPPFEELDLISMFNGAGRGNRVPRVKNGEGATHDHPGCDSRGHRIQPLRTEDP